MTCGPAGDPLERERAVGAPQRRRDRRRRLQRQVPGDHVDPVPGLQQPDRARQPHHTRTDDDRPWPWGESALGTGPVVGDHHGSGAVGDGGLRRSGPRSGGSRGRRSGCPRRRGTPARHRSRPAASPACAAWPPGCGSRSPRRGSRASKLTALPSTAALRCTATRATTPSTYAVQVIRLGTAAVPARAVQVGQREALAGDLGRQPRVHRPLEPVHRPVRGPVAPRRAVRRARA